MSTYTLNIYSKAVQEEVIKYLSRFDSNDLEIIDEDEDSEIINVEKELALVEATRGEETVELNEFLASEGLS
jgi:hypothetical protein